MTPVPPISGIGTESLAPLLNQLGVGTIANSSGPAAASFQSILSAGLQTVSHKAATADELVRRFALDDSVPLHRVTFALEEARLSMEFAMQVRGKLVEAYRELMNMQL